MVFIVLLTDFVECYEILNSRFALEHTNTNTPTQIHVGSVATICAFATKSDAVPHDKEYSMSDLLKMDAIFLTLLIIVLLGKYASGSHSGRSRDMVTLGLLLGVEIIPCLVDPSISVHDNTMSKLLFLAVFTHTASALRLVTRTERFYNLERLVSKALPTILLIVLHTFVWMVVFAIIGMHLFGGKVWNKLALEPFQSNNEWCTTNHTKICDLYDDQYNFNTMTSSLISLYVVFERIILSYHIHLLVTIRLEYYEILTPIAHVMIALTRVT